MKSVVLAFLFACSVPAFAQSEKIEALTREGVALHDKGDYQGAIDKYQKVLAYDPNSDLMNYEIAFSYAQSKMYAKAIEHCDIVINGKGQSQMLAVVLKGSCLDASRPKKEADKFYAKSLKQFPHQYLLLLNNGIRANKLGQTGEAEKSFLEALAVKPDHPGSHLNLAYLKIKDGDKLKGILGLYFFLMLENNTPRSSEALNTLMDNLDIPLHGTRQDSTKINLNIAFPVSHEKLSRTDLGEVSLYLITTMNAELGKNKSSWGKLAYDTDKIFSILGELQVQGVKGIEDYWWAFYVPFFYELRTAGHAEALSYHISASSQSKEVKDWIAANKDKSDAFVAWLKNQ